MRIGIDLFPMVPATGRGAGAHRYVTCLMRALHDLADEHEYFLFVNHLNASMFPVGARFHHKVVPLPPERRVWPFRLVWQHAVLPLWAARYRLNLLHFPLEVAPLQLRLPYVATINDLIADVYYPRHFPGAVSSLKARYQFLAKRHTALNARTVIAPSQATATEVQQHYGVAEQRIEIVPDAADKIFFRNGLPKAPHSNGASPFILSTVSLSPHKNIPGLIEAFARARRDFQLPHELRIVGMPGTAVETIHREIDGARRRGVPVRYLGYVSDDVLRDAYHAASLFVFLPLVEGFGLPLLEAMAAEVPVVASNVSCMPEVCGDAALLVPPSDADAAARAIGEVLTQPDVAQRLVASGRARVGQFSWTTTAIRTREIYERAARGAALR